MRNLAPAATTATTRPGADEPGPPAGFTQVPNEVLRDPDLDPLAKLVYAGLLSYAWQDGACWPEQKTLARELGVSRRTVQNKLEVLAKRGLIEVRDRSAEGRSNVYALPGRGAHHVRRGAHHVPPTKTHHQDPPTPPPPTPLRAQTGGDGESKNINTEGNGNGNRTAAWVREVECPGCGAGAGERCVGMAGHNHRERWQAREGDYAVDDDEAMERYALELQRRPQAVAP